jgi:hypothetical protein
MNIYQFMSDSPWLSFFLAYAFVECTVKLGGRILRSINIAIRGWPPGHLDADGDFQERDKVTP